MALKTVKMSSPWQISTERNQDGSVSVRAGWKEEGSMMILPAIGFERFGSTDRFIVQLPGGMLAEFDFPAERWIGKPTPPTIPIESSRFLEQDRMLGFTPPAPNN